MMASRSKMIDNLVQSHANSTGQSHLFFDDPIFRPHIEKNVEKLETMLACNSNLENAFEKLNKKIKGVEELDSLKFQFENVYKLVSLEGRDST